AESLPPIGESAEARLQSEVQAINDHAIGAGAGNAEEVALFFRLMNGSGQAEGDFADFSCRQFFGGAENVPGKMQFLGENIGGTPGKQSKGHAVPIFGASQTIHNFVEGAIASAGNYQLAPVACGVLRDFGGVPGSGGFGQVRFNAFGGKNAACLVEQA